jgi:hypothetical protein
MDPAIRAMLFAASWQQLHHYHGTSIPAATAAASLDVRTVMVATRGCASMARHERSGSKGLPKKGTMGKIAVGVARSDPRRLYAR